MKNRIRKRLWMIAGIAGILALAADIIFRDHLSQSEQGVLCGLSCSMIAVAAVNLIIICWEQLHPAQMKQNEIESKDERNVMIWQKAQFISGQVLQWSLIAAAWICLMMDGPLWVTLSACGLFFGKIVLEVILNGCFQNRM